MIFVVRRKVNVLTKIKRGKKRQKLRGESICRIIEMNVEVTGDDKFMVAERLEGGPVSSRVSTFKDVFSMAKGGPKCAEGGGKPWV